MNEAVLQTGNVLLQRAQIVKALEALGDLRSVKTHGGRFTEEELKRWGATAPCAVVAAVGLGKIEQEGGALVANVAWAVFLVTKDTTTAKRDEIALLLVPRLIANVINPEQRWDVEGTGEVSDIEAVNMFGSKLDATGLGLWAITWKQPIDINIVDEAALADFLRVRGDFEISDNEDTPETGIAVDVREAGGLPVES